MKYAFLTLLLLFSARAFSQIITIKDQDSGEPIEMATLMSGNGKLFAATDAHGQANVSAFKNAERIEVRSLGYKTILKSYGELKASAFEVQLSGTNISLDAVVVSATRWNQESRDVPSKVVGISAREAALQNPQTAADLLTVSGKVFMQKSQQGGGSPMIRGFATNRLLYTVDGIRMNTAIFRGGNLQNVISLDPLAIENTEIFFGAGSVIYGSDAIGGVMSFKTLTPQLSLNGKPNVVGKVNTRFSSANNEFTGHFDVGVGWNKFAMLTSVSYSRYGDLKMGTYGPDEYLRSFYVQRQDSVDVLVTNDDPRIQKPSGYNQINLMQKFRYAPNDKWDIQYGFHWSETSSYARYDRHIRYENGLPRYGEWSYGPQKWMMNALSITHKGNNALYDQMSLRLAHQFFEESRISRNFNEDQRETNIENVYAYSGNLDFVKSTGSKNKLYYGLEVIWNDVVSLGTNENISTGVTFENASRYPQSNWSSYGLYVSDQYRVHNKVTLQAGLRYNHFLLNADFDTTFYAFPFTEATLNNGSLTGSFGLVYRPTQTWMLSANFGTAFRAPNVDDIGKVFDSEPGSVVIPNPNLNAEYAYNVDVSIAKVFAEVVKLDLTGYHTVLTNALVRRDFTLNGQDSIMFAGELSQVQAMQNAAMANVYGLQAGLEVKLPAGFGLSSDFNWQVGVEELADGSTSPSRHAAPWFGVSRLSYRHKNLNMQFNVEYSGAVKNENLPEVEKGKEHIYAVDVNGNSWSPSWYTLNLKATYQFLQRFTASAGVENISDQRYRPYSSGIVAPGRNFILSLKARF
ncbi:MAG: hemoglobin/transferrin/lactoferrin receptor protein [Alteromonas macleodii]|jgi:hemoglobin/transferrin/lactoferrin receptor protein